MISFLITLLLILSPNKDNKKMISPDEHCAYVMKKMAVFLSYTEEEQVNMEREFCNYIYQIRDLESRKKMDSKTKEIGLQKINAGLNAHVEKYLPEAKVQKFYKNRDALLSPDLKLIQ